MGQGIKHRAVVHLHLNVGGHLHTFEATYKLPPGATRLSTVAVRSGFTTHLLLVSAYGKLYLHAHYREQSLNLPLLADVVMNGA